MLDVILDKQLKTPNVDLFLCWITDEKHVEQQ